VLCVAWSWQWPLMVGLYAVMPARSVHDIGTYLDSDVSMRTHVAKTVSSCFAMLRQIRSVSWSVTKPILVSLVVTLVLTRLDYGCATLDGLPDCLLNRLQSVLNAAARLVNSIQKFDHVASLLHDLHWLRVPERIQFRLAVLVYRCLHDLAPPYLATDCHCLVDFESRQRLLSGSTAELDVLLTSCRTIGNRAFPVAAACIWNGLPSSVTSSPTPAVFRQWLKTELFTKSCGVPRSWHYTTWQCDWISATIVMWLVNTSPSGSSGAILFVSFLMRVAKPYVAKHGFA